MYTGCGIFAASVLCGRRLALSVGQQQAPVRAISQSLLQQAEGFTATKKSAVYTKTGDKGSSSLYNGERRMKTDIVFEALGAQDELGAALGVAREHCALSGNGLESMLAEVQARVFDLGASVATPLSSEATTAGKIAYVQFSPASTVSLERWVDFLDAQLPPLTNFVIASGGLSSTHLNLARAVCRRAERCVVPLVQGGHCDAEVGRYLNRLSDFLFVAGRYAVMKEGKQEIIWTKGK